MIKTIDGSSYGWISIYYFRIVQTSKLSRQNLQLPSQNQKPKIVVVVDFSQIFHLLCCEIAQLANWQSRGVSDFSQ